MFIVLSSNQVFGESDNLELRGVRGHDAVVVIAADELQRLLSSTNETEPFVAFMESLSVDGLDLRRERDLGRDVEL